MEQDNFLQKTENILQMTSPSTNLNAEPFHFITQNQPSSPLPSPSSPQSPLPYSNPVKMTIKPFQLKKKEPIILNNNVVSSLEPPVEFKPVTKKANRSYRRNQKTLLPPEQPPAPTDPPAPAEPPKPKKLPVKSLLEMQQMQANDVYVPQHDLSSLVNSKTVEQTLTHQNRLRHHKKLLHSNGTLCTEDSRRSREIVGTCGDLEKDYFRITSEIDPSKVRPERVLRRSLELVREVWREEGDYSYVSDQLKSIRQDLTVQGIRNDFSLTVYDTHARIALLAGDSSEFGQCLTQLRLLLAQDGLKFPHRDEYTCYYILNCMFTQYNVGLMESLGELTREERQNPFIRPALDLQRARQTGDYRLFFRAYWRLGGFGRRIVDWFVDSFRRDVLRVACVACRPRLSVEALRGILGFEGHEDCLQFLDAAGVVFVGDSVDCKQTLFIL